MSEVSLPDGFFGSPDDDPLLQDDPLATASESERSAPNASGEETGSGDASGDGTSSDEPGQRPRPAPRAGTPLGSDSPTHVDGPSTAATPGGTSPTGKRESAEVSRDGVPASLFRQVVPSNDPRAGRLDDAETTELCIPAREAANGHLAPLRIALSQGWHLTRARVTSPGPDDEKNLALTFTLKRRGE